MTEKPPEELTGGQPTINLTFERVLCGCHGEPFRHEWPAGYPLFIAEGFRRWTHKPETPDQLDKALPTERGFEALLDRVPLCCRFTPSELLDLYAWINEQHKGKRWPKKRCDLCRERAWGGPFQWTDPHDGQLRQWEHLCLRCVVYRTIPGPRDATQQ